MIRNARELKARRQELIGLAAVKRRVASMAKNFAIDTSDVQSLLDDRMQRLSSQIEQYDTGAQQKDSPESIEHLRILCKLPQALIEARIAIGWSQSDLARHAQLRPQHISRYEKTLYANISLAKAIEIAKVLTGELSTRQEDKFSMPAGCPRSQSVIQQ